MIRLQEIIKLDFAYLETLTNRTDTDWGTLFCDETQPAYYDANHAHINQSCDDPQLVIDEVVRYYQSRKIIPRFYLYQLDAQQALINQLKFNHFGFEELISPVQLWDKKLRKKEDNEKIKIESRNGSKLYRSTAY